MKTLRAFALALLCCGALSAQTPALYNAQMQVNSHFANGSTGNGNPTTGCWDGGGESVQVNPFYFCIPDKSQAGNAIVAVCQWAHATGTLTITDDKSQTYTQIIRRAHTAVQDLAVFVFPNTVAGVHQLKASWAATAPTSFVQCAALQFYNILTSAPADGSIGATPTSSTISAGSITSSVSNDMYLQVVAVDDGSAPTYTAGSGWSKQLVDDQFGTWAIQTKVNPTASAMTCSLTLSASATANTVCVALKPATAGVAPSAQYLSHAIPNPIEQSKSSYTFEFPCVGNDVVVSFQGPKTDGHPSAISGTNPTVNFTQIGSVTGTFDYVSMWYSGNITCTQDFKVTVTMSSATNTADDAVFYDFPGTATSNILDFVGGALTNFGNQGAFSSPLTMISNAAPNHTAGMIVCHAGINLNGSTALMVQPHGGGSELSGYQEDQDQNNLMGQYHYTSGGPFDLGAYTDQRQAAGGIGDWADMCVAFADATGAPVGSPRMPPAVY